MNNYTTLKYTEDNNIGFIEFNRPQALNALNETVFEEFKTLLTSICERPLTGVILTGSGEKAFIAGADIKNMSSMDTGRALDFSFKGQEVTLMMEELPFPVIAAVNGYALGGGLEMAMACDFIYATENAVLGLPEVSLGLIPGFGGTQRLTRAIGRNKAKELLYSNGKLDAKEAYILGLVNKVFSSKDELLQGATDCLKKISKNSPAAVAMAKLVVNKGADADLREGLNMEMEAFSKMFGTPEMLEGVNAFIEKRKPNFNGAK